MGKWKNDVNNYSILFSSRFIFMRTFDFHFRLAIVKFKFDNCHSVKTEQKKRYFLFL